MVFKIKPLLLKCDFIGFIPQFRILDDTRYKSIFSSLLSIIIIIFSIAFISYSFIEYANQNPKVEYYKSNDYQTNKTFKISDSLFMFNYHFTCFSNYSEEHNLLINIEDINEGMNEPIEYNTCELGKNIDFKYKNVVDKIKRVEKNDLNNFLCLNFSNKEFTLYSDPSITKINERHLQLRLTSECKDYYILFYLITENDFIDHTKKDNPIVPDYKVSGFVLENEKIDLVYNYQYIKYESDNGYIFTNKTIMNGISVASSDLFDKINFYKAIFSIDFKLNSANYDNYKRSFTKFQSFLADVMSLINLLITISKVISEFLLYKKMNKDIIKYIMISEKIKNNNRIIITYPREKQIHKTFENKCEIEKSNSKRTTEENKNTEISTNNDNLNISNKESGADIEKTDEKILQVMKNLKMYNIIKSFFCCKDKKMQLINLCNNIIYKDISVERILKRLYLIENEFNILMNEEFYQIYDIINSINNEMNGKEKNKLKKSLSINNEIK